MQFIFHRSFFTNRLVGVQHASMKNIKKKNNRIVEEKKRKKKWFASRKLKNIDLNLSAVCAFNPHFISVCLFFFISFHLNNLNERHSLKKFLMSMSAEKELTTKLITNEIDIELQPIALRTFNYFTFSSMCFRKDCLF